MDADSGSESRRTQNEALQRAKNAAESGDPKEMVRALYESTALDGLSRWIHKHWSSLRGDDNAVDAVVSDAVDALYEAIRSGQRVMAVMPFLFKVADRRAYDRAAAKKRERAYDPDKLERATDKRGRRPNLADEGLTWEEMRKQAISRARALLPKLGQKNIQDVMAMIIDAVEAGRDDLPSSEIAAALGLRAATVRKLTERGFKRLAREATKAGLTPKDVDFNDGHVEV